MSIFPSSCGRPPKRVSEKFTWSPRICKRRIRRRSAAESGTDGHLRVEMSGFPPTFPDSGKVGGKGGVTLVDNGGQGGGELREEQVNGFVTAIGWK